MLLFILLVGCIPTSSEPEIKDQQLVATSVPVVYPAAYNTDNGAALFTENCAPCHGPEGQGDGPTASAFSCPMPAFPERRAEVAMEDWYEIVANGNGGEPDCLMPPWSRRLNSEQMWDVTAYAYQMRYGILPTDGAAVLAENRTDDEVLSDLGDPQWQAETSDSELITLLHRNSVAGYEVTSPLAEDEQLMALAYLRGIAYEVIPETASNPLPETTAEAVTQPDAAVTMAEPDAETVQGTPEPAEAQTTPAPTSAATGTFTINGTLVNGTAGAEVPEALTLTLRVGAFDPSTSEETQLYTAETQSNPDGTFVFRDIPLDPRSLAVIFTDHAGVQQSSPVILPGSLEGDSTDLTFTIYEVTHDRSVLSLIGVAALVDAVTEEGASETFQLFEFTNTSDRIFISDPDTPDEYALRLPMPDGSTPAQAQSTLNPQDENNHQFPVDSPNTFEEKVEDNGAVLYGTVVKPMPPGWSNLIQVDYGFPYDGSMEVTQTFDYDVSELIIYVSISRGLELQSSQLIQGGTITQFQSQYLGYSLVQAPLTAGTPLVYRVFDGPQAASNTQTNQGSSEDDAGSFLNENATLILALGVFLLIAGGMFLFYDLQKTRLMAQQGQGTAAVETLPSGKKALIAEIAALDDAYEAGRISEDRYQKRRDALKEALRQVMEE